MPKHAPWSKLILRGNFLARLLTGRWVMDMRAMGKSSAADSERKCLAKRALVGVLVLMEPVSHAWPGGIDSFEQQQFEHHVIARCGADWPDVEPFNPCPNDRLGGLEPPFGGDLIDSNPGDGKCEAIYTISEGDVTIFVHTCTLRAAIMEANALGGGPHTIVLQSGETYTLSLDADGGGHATDSGANNDDLDITSQITIEGNGATIQRSTGMGFGCDLDGNAEQNEFRIFHVQGGGNLTLQNVTVRNGCADGSGTDDSGGGIFNNGATVTITGSTLMGNSADDVGGGIYNFVGTVTITGSTLMGNSADVGGGIDNFRGTVTITNSTISGNSALSFGGGIGNALGGTVTITGSTLSGNTSADDGGGRRPTLLRFNARFGYVLGADIGGTRVRVAVADLNGDLLAHAEEPTRKSPPYVRTIVAQIATLSRQVVKTAGVRWRDVRLLAIGAPGITDVERGIVRHAPNLPGWRDVPLRELMESALRLPVHVDNDVNMAVLGESWRGAARGLRNVAFIAIGAGIGAGLLINGELYRGSTHAAGEVGYMLLDPKAIREEFRELGFLEMRA